MMWRQKRPRAVTAESHDTEGGLPQREGEHTCRLRQSVVRWKYTLSGPSPGPAARRSAASSLADTCSRLYGWQNAK